MDFEVKETLHLLLKNGPTNLQNDLMDWTVEETHRGRTLFYKGKNYIPNYDEIQ